MNSQQSRSLPRLCALVLAVLATTAVTVAEYVGSANPPLALRTRVCIPSVQPDVQGLPCWRLEQPDCPCDKVRATS